MPQNFRVQTLLTAVVPTLMFSGHVFGDMLAPGGFTDNFTANLTDRPDLGGDLETKQYIPFDLTDDQGSIFYFGQVIHDVVRDPQSGTLNFYYRFVNAPSSAILGIEDLTASQFKGYQTDVDVLTDTTGDTAPIDAVRSTNGSDITFDFDSESSRLIPNATSLTFLVKTNATQFDGKGSIAIRAFTASSAEDGSQPLAGGDATVSSFRPIGAPAVAPPPPAAVPLPPALLTGLPTLAGAIWYLRRTRRSNSQTI